MDMHMEVRLEDNVNANPGRELLHSLGHLWVQLYHTLLVYKDLPGRLGHLHASVQMYAKWVGLYGARICLGDMHK
jgi:hypothetical protein